MLLAWFPLAAAPDGAERLDDETRRARRALIDRENHSRPKGNATLGGNRRRQKDGDAQLLAETTS